MIVYASCIGCGASLEFDKLDSTYEPVKALQIQYLGELNIMSICEQCDNESTERCASNPA